MLEEKEEVGLTRWSRGALAYVLLWDNSLGFQNLRICLLIAFLLTGYVCELLTDKFLVFLH